MSYAYDIYLISNSLYFTSSGACAEVLNLIFNHSNRQWRRFDLYGTLSLLNENGLTWTEAKRSSAVDTMSFEISWIITIINFKYFIKSSCTYHERTFIPWRNVFLVEVVRKQLCSPVAMIYFCCFVECSMCGKWHAEHFAQIKQIYVTVNGVLLCLLNSF